MGAIIGGLFGIVLLALLAAFGALFFVGVAIRMIKRLIKSDEK